MSTYRKALTKETISAGIKVAQYAVRGAIPARAGAITKEIKAGSTAFPFDQVTQLNIGNPQVFGQSPVSFFREVLACTLAPSLMELSGIHPDVKNRAKYYLDNFVSMGSYTDSCGNQAVTGNIARFISERDGFPSEASNIVTSNGASSAIAIIMSLIAQNPNTGFMVPVPQYPLYSAQVSLIGGQFVGYYLDEAKSWSVSGAELRNSYDKSVKEGVEPKTIVVINPGNPTGQVLSWESIEEIINFAHEKNLIILADEVYQENIYSSKREFHSFKKVMRSMRPEVSDNVELVSFHSCSKGFLGECGIRGGYMEMINLEKYVQEMVVKWQSISLCSNTTGQVMTDLKLNPPSERMGESAQTIENYQREKDDLFSSLKRRAELCTNSLNEMDNIQSNEVEGSMYAFPSVNLMDKFVAEAKEKGVAPDFLYCQKVLEATGLAMVPGSGFGQKEGTHHFRTTILPLPEKRFENVFAELKEFNNNLHRSYK